MVDDTDQPSVHCTVYRQLLRESWPQQIPSLCRLGHLEPRCPSKLEVAPPLEDPPARGEFSLGVPDVEGIEQADQEI